MIVCADGIIEKLPLLLPRVPGRVDIAQKPFGLGP